MMNQIKKNNFLLKRNFKNINYFLIIKGLIKILFWAFTLKKFE